MMDKINVIITGSRGYTKNYGGWETLVHGMLDNWTDDRFTFYVTEVTDDPKEEKHIVVNGVHCIRIFVTDKGKFKMLKASTIVVQQLPSLMKEYNIQNPLLYILGVRVGFYYWLKKPMLKKNNIAIIKNSDGIGWKRGKYSLPQKIYSYVNSYAFDNHVLEYLVCDAEEMKRVCFERMKGRKQMPMTEVIYYGTNEAPALEQTMPENVKEYFDKHGIAEDNYYLIINRFVPENSYELMISEFMASDTKRDFIIVSNIGQENKFYEKLKEKLHFENDSRIKFVGTVYDKTILNWLRQKARGYLNGHTLGGTNPGLLEALAYSDVNLVRDCPFSREGADDTALYFSEDKPLRELIKYVDNMPDAERKELGRRAKERMRTKFSWKKVDEQYVDFFTKIYLDKNKNEGNIN